ncbi:MAG: hypothetical protein D6712_09795 [Chloroflexi bacterium]|nr:MAG: hypothetical protein D6712_09795 [Chloroflexota bacterium]
MSVKLLMEWDIKPGRDQEYFEFVVREWVPGINRLGVQPIAAWYTIYSRDSNTRQILAEAVADDLETMKRVLQSTEWATLHDKLLDYVENYTHKVVPVTGGFQL